MERDDGTYPTNLKRAVIILPPVLSLQLYPPPLRPHGVLRAPPLEVPIVEHIWQLASTPPFIPLTPAILWQIPNPLSKIWSQPGVTCLNPPLSPNIGYKTVPQVPPLISTHHL
jgi:hypothetical protein